MTPPFWVAWLITAATLCITAVSALSNRYGNGPSCSLLKDLEGVCQLKSSLGSNTTYPSLNGLFMYFGEINCTLTLQQCHKGSCYSFRDLTAQGPPPPDPAVVATTGWFSNFQILSGAEGLQWTREGVAFKATGSEVVVQYSTQLCGDYWRVRGREGQQFCNFPVEAISVVDAGSPVSLPCA